MSRAARRAVTVLPRIEVHGDRLYWIAEAFWREWAHDGRRHRLLIPGGWYSDGNSVPWIVRPLVPGDWTLGVLSVVTHDDIYRRRGRIPAGSFWVEVAPGDWRDPLAMEDGFRRVFPRQDADRLFAADMREHGVPRWRRRAAYRGVRVALWKEWDSRPWREADEDGHDAGEGGDHVDARRSA